MTTQSYGSKALKSYDSRVAENQSFLGLAVFFCNIPEDLQENLYV